MKDWYLSYKNMLWIEKLLNLMQDYLSLRQPRVVLHEHTSSWEEVLAVTQRSALGSLLFLIYINNIPEGIK